MIGETEARELALALGFDRAGVAPLGRSERAAFFTRWLESGHAGEMDWLAERAELRTDPSRLVPEARSALVVTLVYDPGEPLAAGPVSKARVARYAGGEDYHELMEERLTALGDALEVAAGRRLFRRAYVDTGPVLERELGALAGLGWVGKNTCLIDPRLGSYFFLGVLFTDLPLAAGTPEPDHCGSCRACLDACPTDAFPEPYVLDASRCISYTTIEHRGAVPEALRAGQGDWVFGCDVCQEVCPWNQRTRRTVPPDAASLRDRLAPRAAWRSPALAWLLDLDEASFRVAAKGTALRRAKWKGLVRNAIVAAGNSGDRGLVPALRRHAEGGDAGLAEHARWALAQLEAAGA